MERERSVNAQSVGELSIDCGYRLAGGAPPAFACYRDDVSLGESGNWRGSNPMKPEKLVMGLLVEEVCLRNGKKVVPWSRKSVLWDYWWKKFN